MEDIVKLQLISELKQALRFKCKMQDYSMQIYQIIYELTTSPQQSSTGYIHFSTTMDMCDKACTAVPAPPYSAERRTLL